MKDEALRVKMPDWGGKGDLVGIFSDPERARKLREKLNITPEQLAEIERAVREVESEGSSK